MKRLILLFLPLVILGAFAACASDSEAMLTTEAMPTPAMTPAVEMSVAAESSVAADTFGHFATYMAEAAEPQMWAMAADAEYGSWMIPAEPAIAMTPSMPPTQSSQSAAPAGARRRVIRNANIDLESYTFEASMGAIRDIPLSVGGYIERSSMNTVTPQRVGIPIHRTFNITMRVPEDRFEEVVRYVENAAIVITSSQSAQDVTDQFYDISSRLETLGIEEGRLLYLIDQAEELSEIMNLEARLSATRLQIGQYQSNINNLARQSAYSTIQVFLTEIFEAEEEPTEDPTEEEEEILPLTFGDRIGGALSSSWGFTSAVVGGFLIFFAGAVIPVGILCILGFAGYKAYKIFRRKLIAS